MPITTRRTLIFATMALTAGSALQAHAGPAPTPVKVALDWTPNTNHVGLYVARKLGYYRQAGLEATILPYADTSPGTLIGSGIADFGVTGSLGLFTQHAAGVDLEAVFGVVQKETGRLVFKADRKDIRSPADLDGLTYGGFGSDWEKTLVGTIIRNGGGKGDFRIVTLGTSAYQALDNGSVDFTLEVSTWEGVEAALNGPKLRGFSYADYGVPDEQTTLIASSSRFLKAHPKIAAAFVQATQRGYAYAAAHPDEAADILIAANRAALTDERLVHASMRMLSGQHFLSGQTGVVGRLDPAKMTAMGRFLYRNGILRDSAGAPLRKQPDFSAYFTNAYLAQGE